MCSLCLVLQGHRLENSEFFCGRQGGLCTEEEALDLDLNGDQALGAERTT